MQLKRRHSLKKGVSIRNALTTATCTLLGGGASAQASATEVATPWEFDSALLYYSETDRVTAIEPVIKMRKELNDNEFINFRIVVDSLTGSSASGAVPMPFAQTFTQPSGNKTYTTNANETPLDPSFKDTRVALNAEWEKPLSRTLKSNLGANISKEYDYTSLGASASFSQDVNARNTTLTGGISLSYDIIEPVGGVPLGLTEMPDFADGEKILEDSDDTKTVVDLLFGVTQVINRKTLMQLNYTYGSSRGYLTDPYKILSIIDDTVGANFGEIINQGANDGASYRYEARPDSRAGQSLYWKVVHQFEEDVINASYRYYWDDWGISSHTIDMRYRYQIGGGHYLQPHLRYYVQSEADFYTPYLLDSNNTTVKEASSDYRLGDMTTTTIGLLYGVALTASSEFTFRGELMTQSGDEPSKFGALSNQTLFPDVDAIIVQIGYSFQF
ncbi:MAG: DUF3570 domain-containing protein [Gammaproteobacteria bacterium]|nr:DUF3570 domain-containing protein [Gammaproteobacteria bacterium]